MSLLKLIFQGRTAVLIISPEGIKDTRLGSDFIPWDDIEKIDVPAPRRSLGMMLGIILLGLCLFVVAIILTDGVAPFVEPVDWSQPNHHIWLLLAPGHRVTGKLRGSKRRIRLLAEDMQHVCIAVSDLTYRKQGLLELIVKFHQRYKKTEKTEKVV
jgi:translation initiation factor IF-1